MHISTLLLPLSLAGYCSAWAQAADGTWVANDKYYVINGQRVHEACTRMNTNIWWKNHERCAYWLDGQGNISHGSCRLYGDGYVICYPP